MKKISFITIHVGFNFGSVLQSVATFRMLKDLGYEPTLVNYIPPRCTWKYYFRKQNILTFLKRIITFPIQVRNIKIYTDYLRKFVKLSDPIYAHDNFNLCCPKADIYLTGSDQVWNSLHNQGIDKHYFFDGLSKKVVKGSYASSIGRESITDEESSELKRMLSDYNFISVREASAKDMLQKMGLFATQLLDPTFMLDRNAWKSYMSRRIVKKPYILVYMPYDAVNKNLVYKSARKIAKDRNLQVVSFSWSIRPEKMADKTIYFANPGDFLSLMYYADYVITTSFHGTAFSINLNKQFSVYLPKQFSTRITSLLDLCGLKNRIVTSDDILASNICKNTIDYSPINEILDQERLRTLHFLKHSLMD